MPALGSKSIKDEIVGREPGPPPKLDAVFVGLLAFALSVLGSNRPWFWTDEGATISAATRTLPQLWRMLGNADPHQGLYYFFMHVWFRLFPVNEFTARLPSAIAVGIAAAGVVVLAKKTSTRTVAVASGVIFAFLPRVTWAGGEARFYAASMAVAVWLTVFCVVAAQRGTPKRWAVYGLLLVLAGLFNIYLVLLVPAHALAVLAFGESPRRLRNFLLATAGAAVVLVPFGLFARSTFPSDWIPPLSGKTLNDLLLLQYFERPPAAVAVVAGAILAAGLLAALKSGTRSDGPLLIVCLTWLAVPTGALLLLSLVGQPIYYPRFLAFTAPAFAILLGLAVVTVGSVLPERWARTSIIGMVVVFAVAALPNYLAQRGVNSKPGGGMEYAAVASVIERLADPGDCLVVDEARDPKRFWPLRRMMVFRPDAWVKVTDHGLRRTAAEAGRLYDQTRPVSQWPDKLDGCKNLWTIAPRDPSVPRREQAENGKGLAPGPRLAETEAYQVPSGKGFRLEERWQFRRAQVTKSVR